MAGGIDNLTPYQKGQSGNPKGRPKGSRNRSTYLKELLALKAKGIVVDGYEGDITNEIAMNAKQVQRAVELGDVAAYKEIQDTVYGKIVDKQSIEHSFTKMGSVRLNEDTAEKDLSFDVGREIESEMTNDTDDNESP